MYKNIQVSVIQNFETIIILIKLKLKKNGTVFYSSILAQTPYLRSKYDFFLVYN